MSPGRTVPALLIGLPLVTLATTAVFFVAPQPAAAKPRRESSASARNGFTASSYTTPQGSLPNAGPAECRAT